MHFCSNVRLFKNPFLRPVHCYKCIITDYWLALGSETLWDVTVDLKFVPSLEFSEVECHYYMLAAQ